MATKLSESEPRRSLLSLIRDFATARSGNVAMISALMMVPMMGVAGIAVDYGFAVKGQGKLNQVALIAATNAANTARNMLNVAGPGSNSLDSAALAEGKTVAENFFDNQATTISNTTVGSKTVTVKRTGNTITANVTYSATVSTFIAPMFGVSSLNITGGGSMIVGLMDAVPTASSQGLVIDENWSLPAGTSPNLSDASLPVINDWYSGTRGSVSPLVTNRPVTKSDGTTLAGAVLRVGNPTQTIAPLVSKKVYLEKGDHELRYWYRSTVIYPEYEPTFICGTVENEIYWATSITTRADTAVPGPTSVDPKLKQSVRAGVYLDPILTNPQLATSAPVKDDFPTPGLLANGVAENTRNRVDICVYSSRWIQRSIPIKVESSGYFWLSFVSEPFSSDSALTTRNGFYLGPVQFCKGTATAVLAATACSGALNNNWPWAAGTVLYEDTFDETPAVNVTPGSNNFNKSRQVITASSKYETLAPWVTNAYNGARFGAEALVYEATTGGGASDWGRGNIVRSTRLGIGLYRKLLLQPGTYRFQFSASANERAAAAVRQWCLVDETNQSLGYVQKPLGSCICPAGWVTTLVHSDEGLTGDSGRNAFVTGTAPPGYKPGSGGDAFAMSDCHSSNPTGRANGDVYCVLVPRTQYYGFMIRVAGPYLETTRTTYPGFDAQLGTGGAYFDHLQVKVLSMGVTNNLTADFPNFTRDCRTPLVDNSDVPTPSNIINGRIPMWPGYTTKTNARVTVTAPKF